MIGLSGIKQLITNLLWAKQTEIRTHLIGQVISYDPETNTAQIQPVTRVLRMTDPTNVTTVDLPQIDDVPVSQVGSGKVWCTIAPAVGSYGVLHVSDREIETWLSTGGIVDPQVIRLHDMTDAIFVPSVVHLNEEGDNGKFVEQIQTDRISLRTRSGITEVSVLDDETILLKSEKQQTSIDVDGNVSIETDGDITFTAGGNVTTDATETVLQAGSDYAVQFTALKSAFDTLVGDFNTLVSTYTSHIHITTATVGATPTPGVIAPTVSTGTPSTASMDGAKVTDVRLS